MALSTPESLGGQDVATTLERLRFERGLPQRIYCDYGTEFVSAAMDRWTYTNQVILDFSRRGKPTDSATIESFNGRFREECLNVYWFASLEDAQEKIDAFRWDCVTAPDSIAPYWNCDAGDVSARRVPGRDDPSASILSLRMFHLRHANRKASAMQPVSVMPCVCGETRENMARSCKSIVVSPRNTLGVAECGA